ncbi:glycosyl transferase family 2 [Thermodesulfatator indicus DSM 15286]|uniref:Glycosyl transferase family 2 n=1 Tax=Thermodesulfatator indicus (strain DSM 15286 / JCM 11887 / CIR29812) TaxID=667014 RepID=F8ABL3_THEID|nr:glycosyltransferase [Thermodesulfatator indicus]AEH45612.1 glycosyl transferase family 2 [Thermodesulfatator indicus DSM 15286]
MGPLVSVIIPCYNCSIFLEEAIQSVLDQTLKNYEIIIVNDGSTDNSLDIINKYSTNNFIKIVTQNNKGVSAARNLGIKLASGHYYYFLDSDDILHPKALDNLVNIAMSGNNLVAAMNVARFAGSIDNIFKIDNIVADFWPKIIFTNLAPPNAFLFPSSLVKKLAGFNEEIFFAEDWEFLLRIAFAGAKLITTNFIGVYYRSHESSTCKNYDQRKRLFGYLKVKETLCAGFLHRKDLLSKYGQQAFWSTWGTLLQAKFYNIPWKYIENSAKSLRTLSRFLILNRRGSSFIYLYFLLGPHLLLKIYSKGFKHA